MKTQEAIAWAGTVTTLAERLDVTASAISQWGEYPPDPRQLLLERLSGGKLKAEVGCLDRIIGMAKKTATQ